MFHIADYIGKACIRVFDEFFNCLLLRVGSEGGDHEKISDVFPKNGEFGVEKVIQGVKTESVPLGELKKLSEEGMLLFDEELMSFTMGNCITIEDTNGNRKLLKKRYDQKIDAVAAMMDAYVAFKLNREAFE